MNTLDVSRWLGDFYLLATLLLGGEFLVCLFAGQPARRIALAWATAGGLIVLAMLCALPGWSSVHLLSPAPAIPVWAENLQPIAGQAIRQSMPVVPRISEGSSMPAPPLRVEPSESISVIDWGVLVLYLFATCSVIVVVWLTLGAWQVRRLRRKAEPAAVNILAMLSELTPTGMPLPTVGVLDHLPVAVAVGLRKPAILLPRTLVEQARTEQLRTVLAHELAHLRNRDLWLMAGLRVLMVLLWAHPLFWLWRRRVRLDQEVLADTAAAELSNRTVYAEELVQLARYASANRLPRLASSVGLWETRSQLKRRLALLLDEKLTVLRSCSRRRWLGSLVVLLGLAGGLSLVTLTPAEPVTKPLVAEEAATEGSAENSVSGIVADGAAVATPPVETEAETKNGIKWTPTLNTPYTSTPPVDTEEREPTNEKATAPTKQDSQQIFTQLYNSRQPNTLVGICVDANWNPLAKVNVEVYAARFRGLDSEPRKLYSTTTDAKGKYQFENVIDIEKEFPEGLPDNDNFLPNDIDVITVTSRETGRVPGFVGNSLSTDVARHGEANVHLMPQAKSLRGRIVDEVGQPVVGAQVSAGFLPTVRGIPSDINTSITDDSGEYVVDDLAAYDSEEEKQKFENRKKWESGTLSITYAGNDGKPWSRWLWVKHPDYAMKRVEIEKIPGRIDVELQSGAVLTGHVVLQEADKTSQPAKNVEVRLQRNMTPEWGYEFNFQTTGTQTDNEGRYRIVSLPAGKYSCVAENPGWVTLGIEDIELKRGETTEAPELVMTRGGRVRVQLIDDKTGEPLTFEKPTKGYVSPQPRPRRIFLISSNVVEFSPQGIGEQQLPSGNYVFSATVPGSEGQPGWEATTFANIRTPEELNALPTHEVKEGVVLDLVLRMQNVEPRGKATLTPAPSPPSDADKQDEPQKTNEFIPATPPADAEGKDAYENGVFVPEPPEKLMEKLESKIEAMDKDAYENGIFDDKTPSPF